MSELTARERLHNQFRYSVENERGRVLAVATSGTIAYAMFRAALNERRGEGVSLKNHGETLARSE